jgi:hypothetical protein
MVLIYSLHSKQKAYYALSPINVFKSSDKSRLVPINSPSRFGPITINRPSRPTNHD